MALQGLLAAPLLPDLSRLVLQEKWGNQAASSISIPEVTKGRCLDTARIMAAHKGPRDPLPPASPLSPLLPPHPLTASQCPSSLKHPSAAPCHRTTKRWLGRDLRGWVTKPVVTTCGAIKAGGPQTCRTLGSSAAASPPRQETPVQTVQQEGAATVPPRQAYAEHCPASPPTSLLAILAPS